MGSSAPRRGLPCGTGWALRRWFPRRSAAATDSRAIAPTNPTAYMANAVASQGAAVAANGAELLIDPTIKTNKNFPVNFPFSAYACIPGDPFDHYGAEQIANQVEHGIGSIVAHVRAAAPG